MPAPIPRPKKKTLFQRAVGMFRGDLGLPRPPAAAPPNQVSRDRAAAIERGKKSRQAAGGKN